MVTFLCELFILIVLLYIIAFAGWYGIANFFYKKTSYYDTTYKSFWKMRFNVGNYGEYLTYKKLRKQEEEGAKFLFNCYLPAKKDETSEVDVIMLADSGIYVFESKNYSGWIFGSEQSRSWTQTLPNGKKARKEHFYNPIMQNKTHIKWLQNLIGMNFPVYSVIVFSERCTIKKMDVTSPDVRVVKRDRLNRVVKDIKKENGKKLTQEQISHLYEQLYPYTQVGEDVKRKHIERVGH